MGNVFSRLKRMKHQNIIAFIIIFAVICIISSFLFFSVQVGLYIDRDMHEQMRVIQKNSVKLVENEIDYLNQITQSVSTLISKTNISSEDEIVEALVDYSQSANIVRTLFITLDGHSYSNYAGYMGQSDNNTSIDGVPISQIKGSSCGFIQSGNS